MDWIWIVIFIVIALAKGWNKLSEQADDDKPTSKPSPRPVPKRPIQRPVRPSAVPPVVAHTKEWHTGQQELQDFLRTVASRGVPPPPPLPVAQPVKPSPVVEEAPPVPPAKPGPPPVTPSRNNPWTEALRDQKNIRNIVISAEIIGPPKGMQI